MTSDRLTQSCRGLHNTVRNFFSRDEAHVSLAAEIASLRPGETGPSSERLRQDRPQTGDRRRHKGHQDEHQWSVGGRAER